MCLCLHLYRSPSDDNVAGPSLDDNQIPEGARAQAEDPSLKAKMGKKIKELDKIDAKADDDGLVKWVFNFFPVMNVMGMGKDPES